MGAVGLGRMATFAGAGVAAAGVHHLAEADVFLPGRMPGVEFDNLNELQRCRACWPNE